LALNGPYEPLRDDFDKQWRSYSRKILGKGEAVQPVHFPKFISIGGQRSGTTWLHTTLSKHPSVFALGRKEARYFTVDWVEENISAYSRLFEVHFENRNNLISGETTPGYALLPRHAIETIYNIKSDVKILYAIRNPVDQAWSLTKHMLNHQSFEFSNLEQNGGKLSVDKFIKQFLLDVTIASSDHEAILKRWLSVFPRENCFIYFFDELKESPEKLIENLQDFLGIVPKLSLSVLGAPNLVKQGLSGDIPDILLTFLRTLWRGRLNGLADYLNKSLNITVPNSWKRDFVEPVFTDDIKIHANPNSVDYYMKGGIDGGWFFAKSKTNNLSNTDNSTELYRYLFDLHHTINAKKQMDVERAQISDLRQERIINHMNTELFFKNNPGYG